MSEIQESKPWLWTAGNSPRTGGRSKMIKEVRDLAKGWTMEALSTIKYLMDDIGTPSAVRLAAANSLLDRAWGKPEQAHKLAYEDNREKIDPSQLSTTDLRKMLFDSLVGNNTNVIDAEIIKEKVD